MPSPDLPLRPTRWLTDDRLSTDRQGNAGLGLEAQRAKVEAMASERGAVIAAEFVEVESGRKNDRPQLAVAKARGVRLSGYRRGASALVSPNDIPTPQAPNV
ncbi:MAG: recombinase family protein [Synechococcus sp.]